MQFDGDGDGCAATGVMVLQAMVAARTAAVMRFKGLFTGVPLGQRPHTATERLVVGHVGFESSLSIEGHRNNTVRHDIGVRFSGCAVELVKQAIRCPRSFDLERLGRDAITFWQVEHLLVCASKLHRRSQLSALELSLQARFDVIAHAIAIRIRPLQVCAAIQLGQLAIGFKGCNAFFVVLIVGGGAASTATRRKYGRCQEWSGQIFYECPVVSGLF